MVVEEEAIALCGVVETGAFYVSVVACNSASSPEQSRRVVERRGL